MNAIIVMISGLFQHVFITGLYPHNVVMHFLRMNTINLFNGQFLFVLKFFGELVLIFILGGLIGKLLHLDRVDKEDKSGTHAHS
jgi:hypothetical protein